MKPLKLELKNFGPYRNEKIDFESLDDMFLITGPTGSGKTFIFDAMTFALFGCANGNRGEKSLKSTFADNEDEAFVTFEFLLNGEIFRITRTLPYDHVTKTGKITHKQSEIEVYKKSGDNIFKPLWNGEKLSEINKKLISLIGLKAEEFSMVVVLPQGEFAKFLKENSTARTQTLSKIFPVSLYSHIMESVKIKYDEAQSELSGITGALKQLGTDVHNEDLVKEIKNGEILVSKLSKETLRYEKLLEDISVKGKELQMKYEEASRYETNVQKLNLLSKEKDKIEGIKQKIEASRKALKVYPLYLNQQYSFEKIVELKEKLENLNSQFQHILEEEKKLLKKEKKIEEIKTCLDEEKNKLNLLKTAEELSIDIEKLKEKKPGIEKDLSEIEKQISDLNLIILDLEKQKKELELQNISSVVAESLEEGKPCPVCGSVHHPKPAEKVEEKLGIDEKIAAEKKSLELFTKQKSQIEKDLTVCESSLKLKEKSFSDTGFSLPLPDFKNEEKKLRENEKAVFDFEKEFNQNKQSMAGLKGNIDSSLEGLEIEQKTYDSLKAEYEKAFIESGFSSIAEVKENFLENKEIDLLEKKVNSWNEEMSALKALVLESSVTEKSSELSRKILDMRHEYEKNKNEYVSLKTEYEKENASLIRNKEIQKRLSELEENRVKLEKKVEPLKMLYNDLHGNNPKKLKFDSWALGVYFDQVLQCASRRFSEISDKRYYFKMKEEISGGGKQGLDFLVCDTYNGTEREVGTLSGGETFMASISLALAMTDFVGGRNCGLQMDSLFIDEGFGTLDAETQDMAMEILTRLGEGNKKIGIISHVENLKQRITSQITISKTSSGSHISQ